MTTAGYSGTPLPRKLGIKGGHRVALFAPPESFLETLGELPHGVSVVHNPRNRLARDVLIAFARTERELISRFDRAHERLDPWGGLWLAWPKQSSPLATAMRESDVRRYGLSTGLVDNKVCAIDEDWSGLRFVVRVEDRPSRR